MDNFGNHDDPYVRSLIIATKMLKDSVFKKLHC